MNFYFFGSLVVATFILSVFYKRSKLSKKLRRIREIWGTIPDDAFDIETAQTLIELNPAKSHDQCYCIDEDTWQDLDLDEVFTLLNRTTTPIGTQNLYYLLRHPVLSKEILADREELMNHFAQNQDLREKVQLILQRLKEKNARYLPYSLWKPLPEKPGYAKFLPILSFMALLMLALVLMQFVHFISLIAIFIVHLVIHSLVKRKMDAFFFSFQYLGVLIRVAVKISSLKFNELKNIQSILKKNLKNTEVIANKIFAMQFKDEFGFSEYFNIYFLLDITGFYSALGKIEQHLEELRKIYETVGFIDALISVASFRQQFQPFCLPDFIENRNHYSVQDIYHPLLESPVSNSFSFEAKNILITGSNMAGKTTFLKTMGVNAILAQTIHTCMAEKYEASFIRVISSIGRSDNLMSGKSYYLAEVESILRILKASESEDVHLLIVDELFRGTNSVERFAASIEVLQYLANAKDFVLIASHDLQLSEILKKDYRNYNFREQVCVEGLTFDYKLHPGPSTTRNAIALLDLVGYPRSIVDGAYQRIKNTS